MNKSVEKQLLYIVFAAIILLQFFFLFLNTSTYGGADNIAHFQIAKYSFKYPELFLDHWGKPVYTTLVAPFTLFGFKAAKAFNLLIAFITLLIISRLSKQIYPGSSILTVILIAFSPVYFSLMISCLTEVLFSLVLVVAVYLFYKDKFTFSAIVLSFIPFIRTEGIILLPIFALAFILKKSSLSIIYLFCGLIFYTVIGYFVFDDILWLINRMPYSMGESVYGSGELFHFIEKSNLIFGIPFMVMILFGLVFWLFEFKDKFSLRSNNLILFIVITGSWVAYFAAHSYVWWKGSGGSLGLIRVMGGIIPLAALTGVKTIQFIFEKIKNRYYPYIILSTIGILQIIWLFAQHDFPLKADPTQQLMTKCADYIHNNENESKVFYFNPFLIHKLEIDPYDKNRCNWGVGDKIQPSNSMQWGDLIVWDAHFGANEGRVVLKDLENDPNLQNIKSFYPVKKVVVLGGYDYNIQVFKKVRNKQEVKGVNQESIHRNLNFENSENVKVDVVNGQKALIIDESVEYSPSVIFYAKELSGKEICNLSVHIEYYSNTIIKENEVLLIFSIEDQGEHLRYEKIALEWNNNDNNWINKELKARFSADIPESGIIKIYVWNRGRKYICLKEINAEILNL